MDIARFEKRIFAYLIDLFIGILFGVAIAIICALNLQTLAWYFSLIIAIVFTYVFYCLIYIFTLKPSNGFTLGSYIFKIRTVNKDHTPIDWKVAVVKGLYLGLVPYVLFNAIYMLRVHTELTIFDKITDTYEVEIDNSSI